MRPLLLPAFLFFVFSLVSSCDRREVKLSPMDTFTGGRQKEWLIAENFFSGVNVTETDPCYKDDTVIFSKGEEGEDKLIPIYIWKKNAIKCSGVDDDLKLYFFLSNDMTTITFGDRDVLTTGTGDVWNINKAENTEIVISQNGGTPNERRLRFIPFKTTADTAGN